MKKWIIFSETIYLSGGLFNFGAIYLKQYVLDNPSILKNSSYNLSQDEIDQIMKELNDSLNATPNILPINIPTGNYPITATYDPSNNGYQSKDEQLDFFGRAYGNWDDSKPAKECEHEWYQGWHDKIAKCTKCGKVKPE